MPGLRKHCANATLAGFTIRTGIAQPGWKRKPVPILEDIFKGEFLFSHCVLSAIHCDINFISIHKINSFRGKSSLFYKILTKM